MRLYNFSDVVGNSSTIRLIKNSLNKQAFPKFTILSGVPGTGKSTCAEIAGLYLTCEHPNNGEPCLACRSCTQNIKALKTTGQSTNLIKKNLGKLNSRKDVLDLIKEIFVLQAPIGNNVYILEEAHSLTSQDQTALLEEIDRLDVNTYIIVCTTKLTKLIPELRSRAINFNFNRLNSTESKLLFDKTCSRLGIGRTKPSIASMIINYSRGVPRDMVNLIEFVNDNSPSEEDIANFLNIIDNSIFTELLINMRNSLEDTIITMDYLFNNYSYDMIIEQFKNYFVDVMFLITGGIKGNFSQKEVTALKGLLNTQDVFKISKLIQGVNPNNTGENDLKLLLIKIRQTIASVPVSAIISESTKQASKQHVTADRLYKENKKIREERHTVNDNKLTKKELLDSLRGNTKVSEDNMPNTNTSEKEDNRTKPSTTKLNIFGGD